MHTRARPSGVLYPVKGHRVKVGKRFFAASATGRHVVTVALSAVLILAANVAPAHAITRTEVLKRAHTWIKRKIKYSQSAYYQGYRRDCSGFVSMSWKLHTSYTSSTIRSRARRISWRSLKPGDAVRRSGHVEIFGGWKNKRTRTYWALEESTWGRPALRKAKRFKRGYSALRLHGIKDMPKRTSKPKRVAPKPPVVAPAPLPSTPATSTDASAGVAAPSLLGDVATASVSWVATPVLVP